MVWPDEDEDDHLRSYANALRTISSSPPPFKKRCLARPEMSTYDLDNDKLWFRERWLRTTVTGDLADATVHYDDERRIHHDPHGYCKTPALIADDHAPSTLTPDTDPRSASNDFDVPEDTEGEDDTSATEEYEDEEKHDRGSVVSRAPTPEPHQTFTTDEINIYTRIQAHLTTLEDLLAVSTTPSSLFAHISRYLPAFEASLRYINRGGNAQGNAAVKLMRVARIPSADGLADQGKAIMERLKTLKGEHGAQWDIDVGRVGVPLPISKSVELNDKKVVSMFELFDAFVLPFFTMADKAC